MGEHRVIITCPWLWHLMTDRHQNWTSAAHSIKTLLVWTEQNLDSVGTRNSNGSRTFTKIGKV